MLLHLYDFGIIPQNHLLCSFFLCGIQSIFQYSTHSKPQELLSELIPPRWKTLKDIQFEKLVVQSSIEYTPELQGQHFESESPESRACLSLLSPSQPMGESLSPPPPSPCKTAQFIVQLTRELDNRHIKSAVLW